MGQDEQREFIGLVQQKLADLTGNERDDFIDKTAEFIDNESVWEINHARITRVIADYIERYGTTPTKTKISLLSGLSAKTVRNHMAYYKTSNVFKEQTEAFKFMTPKLLSVIMRQALKGDLKAAKLILNTQAQVNSPAGNDVRIENHHNYVQINNTVLSQETLQQLKPEQLLQIEQIVQNSLPLKKE